MFLFWCYRYGEIKILIITITSRTDSPNSLGLFFASLDSLGNLKGITPTGVRALNESVMALSHNAVENVCIAWCNGLRRSLELPFCTHSRLMAPVCGFLRVRDELVCRSASFIAKCLQSENTVVHSVSRNGVFCRRMLSPIGMNAHFVCEFCDVSMCDISVISKCLAWSVHNDKVAPELDKIHVIKELLHVKFGHSVLLHFDSADIDIIIEQLCTE